MGSPFVGPGKGPGKKPGEKPVNRGGRGQEIFVSLLVGALTLAMVVTLAASTRVSSLVDQSSSRACETERLIVAIDDLVAFVDSAESDREDRIHTAVATSGRELIRRFEESASRASVDSEKVESIVGQVETVLSFPETEDAKLSALRRSLDNLRESESREIARILSEWHDEAALLSLFVVLLQVLSIGALVLCIVFQKRLQAQSATAQRAANDLARLVEFSHESIFSVDRECRIISWNPGSERMFACSSGLAIGTTLKDWIRNAHDLQSCQEVITEGKTSSTIEVEMVRKDGTSFWAALSISPIESVLSVEEASHTLVASDITEQVNLRVLQADFVASLSHDLKNPIIANNLALNHIVELTDENSRIREIARKVVLSNQQIIDMLTGMLDLYKVNSGKFSEARMPVIVEKLISDCVECLEQRAELKRLSLETAINCRARSYTMDPLIVKKIILNLLDNAVKFAPNDSTVRVCVEDDDNFLRIAVEDTGPGIPDSRIGEIFSGSPARHSPGTSEHPSGFGLYLARKLSRLIGADLSYIRSESGVTRFELRLMNFSMAASDVKLHEQFTLETEIVPAGVCRPGDCDER